MQPNFKHIIEEAKQLNSNERALIAHCLISSLESNQEDYVDSVWADLAEICTQRQDFIFYQN